MDYKFDLPKLESLFSNNFSSHLYAILADEYLKKNDLSRAYTVAKIGQDNYPDDLVGKYVLAKIYLLKNKIKKATGLLEEILRIFPLHLNARKLLIEIFRKQNDSKKLDYQIVQLQKYFPNHSVLKNNKSDSGLNDDLEFKISSMNLLSEIIDNKVRDVILSIELNDISESFTEDITTIISKNSGKHSIVINVIDSLNKYHVDLLSRKMKVSIDKEFMSQINAIGQVKMRIKK